MNTFINKTIKLFAVALLFGAGAITADASFVVDPARFGTGFTAIGNATASAYQLDSYRADISSPGDSEIFYVFMAYQNAEDYTLENVRGFLTYPAQGTESSQIFTGRLSAGNGSSMTDRTTLTGLPSEWEIKMIDAWKENTHDRDPECGTAYGYRETANSVITSSGTSIGSLDTKSVSLRNGETGACSQGNIVVKFQITNTSLGNGGPDNNTLVVRTDSATSVSDSQATLNGDLISGGPAQEYWFMLSKNRNPGCRDFGTGTERYNANTALGQIGSGANPSFSSVATSLSSNTTYYYVACAQRNLNYAEGVERSFYTGSGGGSGTGLPIAITNSARDVQEDSAELRGSVDMNSYNDGLVFFVWGEDEDRVEDVSDEDQYSDVQTRGDDLEKYVVDYSHDGNKSFSYDIDNLREDERYYFRICVEYDRNGREELSCGSVRDFETNGDSNDNGDVEIETLSFDDVGRTFARICGDLEDDGGDRSIRTRMEFRRATGGQWNNSQFEQRGEGRFCVRVNNLQQDTRYAFRACTDDEVCGNIRYFTTLGDDTNTEQIEVNTLSPSNITTSTAILNGRYQGSENEPTELWFEWGTTANLGIKKRTITRSALAGNFVDAFTGLQACTQYFYRAVGQNSSGIDYGNTLSFRTSCIINTGGGPDVIINRDTVVIEETVDEDEINLDLLGLGLSLIRLDIDNNQDVVYRDQVVVYDVRWENISTIDLDTIDVKVTLPEEVSVTSVSRGRFDANENVLFFTIDELDEGDEGDMQISVVVSNGRLGDLVTAEATAAYDNPINQAKENATDYDADEFVLNTNFGTASVFGLSNITFLGWLTILLGLLILFLIARWLYLEREELRAHAYARAYYPPQPLGYQQPPVQPLRAPYQQVQQPLPGTEVSENTDDGYQPYRPNRN